MIRTRPVLLALLGAVLVAEPAMLAAQRQPAPERPRVPRGTDRDPPRPSPSPTAAPAAAGPAGAANPANTKRTWDFFKRLRMPRFTMPSGDCGAAAQAFGAELAAFRSYVDDGLAQPLEAKKVKSERAGALRQLASFEREADAFIADWEKTGQYSPEGSGGSLAGDLCTAQYQRQNLLALREMLTAMARIWPDLAEVQPVLQKVNAGLARMGDDKALERHVAANRRESLKLVRMKPALARNPAWEAEMRSAFAGLRPGETVLKINLYSTGWYVKRNEVTGVPEYRQYGAWVGSRRPDGTCRLYSLDAFQAYSGGGGFGASEYKLDSREGREILCENI